MLIRVLLFVAGLLSIHVAEGKTSEEAPISAVTVFRDRASVKRSLSVKLPKGATTLTFRNVTPLLDLDSLKATLTEKKRVTLMGIRTTPEFSLKSSNRELEKWTDARKAAEKKRQELTNEVKTLLQSNQNLDLLTQHYRDSFSLNLHQNSWTKAGFESFIRFLTGQSDQLNGKWAKLYEEYRKVSERVEFADAKISELATVSDRKSMTVSVDVIADEALQTEAEIQYLVTHCGWSAAYDLRIEPGMRRAVVEQHAFVWQKSGEDWSDVALVLSNVRSELRPVPPTIGPYVLSYREVKEVKTGVSGAVDSATGLTVGAAGEGDSADENAIAKNFKVPGAQTIRDGRARTRVFVAKKDAEYSERLELVAADYKNVYRKGELANPFAWDLEAGPASVYYDGGFLQQMQLENVARGNKFGVNAGIDHDFYVSRSTQDKTEEAGLMSPKKHFKREVTVFLKSYGAKRKNVRVYEQVPISEIKEVVVETKDTSPGLRKDEEHPGWNFWEVDVDSKRNQALTLNVDVAVPASFDFAW